MKHTVTKIFLFTFLFILIISIVFLFIAIREYPGKNIDATGFSFLADYWCDLYKLTTPTGETNAGMLYAKLATLTAAVAFGCFWIAIPLYYIEQNLRRIFTQISGTCALFFGAFLFTGYHDLIIYLGSLCGVFALLSLIYSLYQSKQKKLFYLGIVNVLLIIACNIMLLIDSVDLILPVLQKISFIGIVYWTASMAINILGASKIN